MSKRKTQRKVGGLLLNHDRPTRLSLDQLRAWVVWQFPRPKFKGMCGAVHPPAAGHGWIPAIILGHEGRADVYGHIEELFATPEAAADWISTA